MSNKLEHLENNMVKITMDVDPKDFDAAVQRVYLKNRSRIQIPGFRKGKAPRTMIEKMYGKGVFYEDALNDLLPDLYDKALKELEIKPASNPEINVESLTDEEIVVTATVALRPELENVQYKNLEVARDAVIVTEDDVEEDVKKTAERNSRLIEVTDRPAAMDDTVTIDYEGFIDGTAFDGGKGTDHALVLGSHSFIDTFEDQLVGKNVGDDVEVNVTFPEDYHSKDLAGKTAQFKVSVKKIQKKEVPEIDDEFAKDVSEFDTLDEYKADVRVKLTERKQREADEKYLQDVLNKIMENTEINIPQAMLETELDNTIRDMSNRLQSQGMDINQYLSFTGGNMASFRASQRPMVEQSIKRSLILEAVAKAEGITVTDEDIDKEVKDLAEMYRMEEDQVRAALGDAGVDSMKESILERKALDVLKA